jgi:hypothetical protein
MVSAVEGVPAVDDVPDANITTIACVHKAGVDVSDVCCLC